MKLPGRGSAAKAKVATPDDRMTLVEHLAELRTRIIRALLAVVIGVIVVLAAYNTVLDFLLDPVLVVRHRLGRARPSWPSTPSLIRYALGQLRAATGVLHHADQGALQPEVQKRSRRPHGAERGRDC
jgi:hypothetical protein